MTTPAQPERLTAQDASFLYAETPAAHMHVGSLVVFDDSGFTEADLRAHIESRLHKVPRFRKKLAWVPLDAGLPIWVDDPHFDLRFHIRHTGLPKPGGRAEALRLMGRVMSLPLDRARPLWEMWLFDLPDGRRGLIQKTHHCLIDGISGVDLGTVLLDFGPKPRQVEAPEWTPVEPPTRWELLRDTWLGQLRSPDEIKARLQKLTSAGTTPLLDKVEELSRGLLAFGKATLDVCPKTSLNAPIGPHRRFAIARAELAAVKRIKNHFDCKVNDVVLAIVSGALRHILLERGEEVAPDCDLHALVPVSMRSKAQRHTYGNQVAAMKAHLPVGEADPARRLERVALGMDNLKASGEAVGADFWLKAADFAPPTVVAMASRAMAFQRLFNLAVTNVPGPQIPLYLLGGRLREAYPYVPLVGTAALGVAVLSYDGRLFFGVSGDWDVLPDLETFTEGVGLATEELLALAG